MSLRHALDIVEWSKRDLDITPDDYQVPILRSTSKRLAVLASRQSGKSTCCVVRALHRCRFKPGSKVAIVCPTVRQSAEDLRTARHLAHHAGMEMVEESRTSLAFDNGARLFCIPANQTLRGVTLHEVIVDEGAYVEDEVIEAVKPALAATDGVLVLSSTAGTTEGHFYRTWTHGVGWERVKVTADQVGRISRSYLESERVEMAPTAFRREFYCEFGEPTEALFGRELAESCLRDDVPPLFGRGAPGPAPLGLADLAPIVTSIERGSA